MQKNNKINNKLLIASASTFACFSVLWLIHVFLWANCYTGDLMDLTNYLYNSIYAYWSFYVLGFLFLFIVLLYSIIYKARNLLVKNKNDKNKTFLIIGIVSVAISFAFFIVSSLYGNREFVNGYLRLKYQQIDSVAEKILYSAWFEIVVIALMCLAFTFNLKVKVIRSV